MARFTYTAADLDRFVGDVLGGEGLTLADFGVAGDRYEAAAAVDFDACESNDGAVPEELCKAHGFDGIADFMEVYTRSHVWNNYHYNYSQKKDKKDTLREFLLHYHNKAKRFHPDANVPLPGNEGDILEYLKGFAPAWLVSVGW